VNSEKIAKFSKVTDMKHSLGPSSRQLN